MSQQVIRRWARHDVTVATLHPECGELHRGRIRQVHQHVGVGAFCVWEIADADWVELPLLVAGDYLSAEAVLLAATEWAADPD